MSTTLNIYLRKYCCYHPQSTGLVERSNGIIKNKLKVVMTDTGKSWVENLPLVLLNTWILKCSQGLSEIVHKRPYTISVFHLSDTPEDNDLYHYMAKMLRKRDALKTLSPPQGSEAPPNPLVPGDWILVRQSRKRTGIYLPGWDCSKCYSPHLQLRRLQKDSSGLILVTVSLFIRETLMRICIYLYFFVNT